MTKEAALYNFWSGFALPAYEENAVFSEGSAPAFPYITYEVQTGEFGSALPLSASIWYRSSSWTAANAKKREISEYIGMGGIQLPCDEGYIWITRGSTFAQNMGDSSDDMIKRIVLSISAEFFTAD